MPVQVLDGADLGSHGVGQGEQKPLGVRARPVLAGACPIQARARSRAAGSSLAVTRCQSSRTNPGLTAPASNRARIQWTS